MKNQENNIQIYHNPRCSKSRDSFKLLEARGFDFDTIEYLKTPPNKKELIEILKKLDFKAEQLIRKTEAVYKENYKGKELSQMDWLNAMLEHPKLIERPIVIKGEKAVIGRPIQKVIDLLG